MKKKTSLLTGLIALSIALTACSTKHPDIQTNQQQETKVTAVTPPATAPAAQPASKQTTAAPQTATGKLIPAKIISVTDGDTMKVELNGKKETIRLLLVDTPEVKHPSKPVQPFGPEASAFAKQILKEGKEVQIEIDVSERDKYGRLLAYLWVDGKMFNEMLLEKGLARVAYVYPPNIKYVDQFRAIQKKAQTAGIGIWSIENYAQEDGFHPKETATKKAEPTKQQSEKPVAETQKSTTSSSNVQYKNCTEARAAGVTPIYEGQPGYSRKLDRDGDGVACE
ncbi:thermonuclease family protein [Aneurinibacillus aneurinilyticus]|uniref:thermonuclease family protein n=1 Tax=Aneurinibacillus aneurinilyticus TaxID=1391 RepID=UPI002E23407A|nr:thermonuclease family protein [Aneurinibacillus aneurinilyticus]